MVETPRNVPEGREAMTGQLPPTPHEMKPPMEEISNSPERAAHVAKQGTWAEQAARLRAQEENTYTPLPNDLSLPQPGDNKPGLGMGATPTYNADWALDRAFTEMWFTNTAETALPDRGLETRAAEIAAGAGVDWGTGDKPADAADMLVATAKEHVAKGWVTQELGLQDMSSLTPDQARERALAAYDFLDFNKFSGEQLVAAYLFATDDDWASYSNAHIEFITSKQGIKKLDDIRQKYNKRQGARLVADSKRVVEEYGLDNYGFWGSMVTELIPGINVAQKQGLLAYFYNKVEETYPDHPDVDANRVLLGSGRDQYRQRFEKMTAQQQKAEHDLWFKMLQELDKHPVFGKAVTDYNIMEQSEELFTKQLLEGGKGRDLSRVWWGNIETIAEFAILVGPLAFRGAKSLRNVVRRRRTGAAKAADIAGNRAAGTELRLVEMTAAERLRIDQSTAAAQMPQSPLTTVEEVHLPGYDVVVEHGPMRDPETQRVLDELDEADANVRPLIMEATEGRLSRALSDNEKSFVVKETLRGVQRMTRQGHSAVVVPEMSVVREVPDGIEVQAVLSKNGGEAYKGLDDLVPDLLDMDPNLEHFSVLRRADDGSLEQMNIGPEQWQRILLNNFDEMTDAELLAAARKADPESIEWHLIEREAAARQGQVRMPNDVVDDEFFLQQVQFRPWHPTDKQVFGSQAFVNTGIPMFRSLLSPNAKFGDEIVGQFLSNYLDGARTKALFEGIYKPYYKLNSKSKQAVAHMLEWEEAELLAGRGPASIFDFYAQFPDITDKELKGLAALKRGFQTQYEVFNRRMYLDMLGSGYRTARPIDGQLPRYHGNIAETADAVNKEGKKVIDSDVIYNPVTQKQEVMTRKDLEAFYAGGGRVMKLDIPVQAGNNAKSTLIKIDPASYKAGDLSTTPLEHVPNYTFRFYEDPYYIVKVLDDELVDGAKAGRSVDATATVGSELKAKAALNRMGSRIVDPSDGKPIWISKDPETGEIHKYRFTRARDVEQTDAVLLQKQTLNKTGRLFWDKRDIAPMNDIDGGRAAIMDMTLALERGTELASRLNAQEDAIRALKEGLKNDYGKTANLSKVNMATMDTNAIVKHIKKEIANSTSVAHKGRLRDALEVAKYIRQMEGIDSVAVRKFRSAVLNAATWVERITAGRLAGKRTQNWAMTTDPLRSMRSTAFKIFMVFRPFRQAILQASQPMFLAGIDPVYVLSGKGATDSLALRMAASRHAAGGFDAGYSNKVLAGMMGLSKKEFTRLVSEFEKSGAISVVDAHAFAGGAPSYNKVRPHDGTVAGRLRMGAQVAGHSTMSGLKQVGFDFGESINKTASFNIAWRRVKKQKGYKSLLELTPEDWRQVKMDTENLSLSMSRPNNFAYQQGFFSVGTQFLSFSHKVAQAMMFRNPALNPSEVRRLWVGMFVLFGANTLGARDWTREKFHEHGLYEWAEQEVDYPGFPVGTTLLDVVSGGAVQSVVNGLGTWTDEDFQKIDTEGFTPVLNVTQFNELFLESLLDMDAKMLLGPFGNRGTAMLRAWDDAQRLKEGFPPRLSWIEKYTAMAAIIGSGTLPQWSNVTQGLAQYGLKNLYLQSGESVDIETSLLPTLAKIGFGGRTMAEVQYYRSRSQMMDSDEAVRKLSSDIRRTLKQYWNGHQRGEVSDQMWKDVLYMASWLAEQAPDGRKMEVLNKAMIDVEFDSDKSIMHMYMDTLKKDQVTPAQMKGAIKNMNMPPEAEATIMGWVDNIMDDRIRNDAELLEAIQKGNMQ